ncbi:hypothetical protein C8F01DRAFT_1075441 [Mycena amicta]|nr:hypothetical protein C8F01DRAFT_1075441 [Mycena amicta]
MSEHLRTTVKLLEDAAGYATWETKLRDILTDQDYDEYVFGSKTAEPKINDAANASEVKANADWKRKQHAKQPTAKPEADSSSTALSAYRSKSGSHAQHNSRPGGCYSCGRPGHREAECRDKQNGRTYTEAQKNANYERAKQNYKGIDRSNSDSANMATEPTRDVAFIARDVHQSTPDSRLLDSGASIHITYNDHHNRQSTTDAAQLQGESTPGTSLTPSPATTTPIQLFLQTDAPIEITGLLITALTSTHLANTDTVRRFSRSIVHHCASTPTLLTPTYTEIDSPVRGGVL